MKKKILFLAFCAVFNLEINAESCSGKEHERPIYRKTIWDRLADQCVGLDILYEDWSYSYRKQKKNQFVSLCKRTEEELAKGTFRDWAEKNIWKAKFILHLYKEICKEENCQQILKEYQQAVNNKGAL